MESFALCFPQLTGFVISPAVHICHDVNDLHWFWHVDALAAAFQKHVDTFGGLDICINCAGFVNKSLVYDDKSDGISTWRRAVNVNLVAVIDGTRIAVSLSSTVIIESH